MHDRRVTPGRRTALTLVTAACVATLAACSGGSAKPAATPTGSLESPTSAAELLQRAEQDAVAEGSVRVTSVFRRGSQSERFREDVALDSGRQIIHFGAIRAEVMEVDDRAYITGNDLAMTHFFGLPKQKLARFTGRWVSLTPADSDYATVVTDVTIRSDIADLIPSGTVTRTDTMSNGDPVIVISGGPPTGSNAPARAQVHLYVSTDANPLPVRELASAPDGTSETASLSHWGEPVMVVAPRHAIPISTIDPSL